MHLSRRRWELVVTGLALVACARPTGVERVEREAAVAVAPALDSVPLAARSAGCGLPAQAHGEFAARSVRVGNLERSYHVRLPDGYDPARAYPVVFRWHGAGGDGLAGGLGIESSAGREAIVVAADGLHRSWSVRSEANDLALFDAMLSTLSQSYCVDGTRVFAYGFSAGGGLTTFLGCRRASQLRAIAAIATFDRGMGRCDRSVAAWFLHDKDDEAAPIDHGRSARDRMLERNHCKGSFVTLDQDCVRYEGCSQPVVWCETRGRGHHIAGDTAPAQVWGFFRALPAPNQLAP
jgi:polyhydroxybutyrate depolymerase